MAQPPRTPHRPGRTRSVTSADTVRRPARRALPTWSIDAQIPGDRRQALLSGALIPDRTRGAVLFADISGFTPLTEALAGEGGHRGPEELSLVLETVYNAVLAEVHRSGGVVIFFSGDAVTCWFDQDDGSRAIGCAGHADAMARVRTVRTAGGTAVHLGLKLRSPQVPPAALSSATRTSNSSTPWAVRCWTVWPNWST